MIHRFGRIALLLMGLVCAGAAAASNGEPMADCRRYTRQIDHFEGVADMARERGNALWEQETERHIERLTLQRANRCPRYMEELQQQRLAYRAAEATKRVMKKAGEIALRVFTFGAY